MYKQHELESGLQKLADHRVVLMEDDWTVASAVASAVGNWYGHGGDDVSDKQTGEGFSSVLVWIQWLWDNEYVTLLGEYADDPEAVVVRFKELQPEATATEQVEA